MLLHPQGEGFQNFSFHHIKGGRNLRTEMSGADKGCRLSCFEIRAALHGISAIGAMDKTCQRILHDSIYTCWSIMLFHFRLCKIPEFFWDDGFMQTINEQIIFCQRTRFFDFSIFRMFFSGRRFQWTFPIYTGFCSIRVTDAVAHVPPLRLRMPI